MLMCVSVRVCVYTVHARYLPLTLLHLFLQALQISQECLIELWQLGILVRNTHTQVVLIYYKDNLLVQKNNYVDAIRASTDH